LARRGGLDPRAVPFTLDDHSGQLYISASGNRTASVTHFTVLGMAKVVEDARLFIRTFPDSNSNLVVDTFPALRVKGPKWTEANIVRRKDSTDSLEMGAEIYHEIEEQVPELKKWSAPGGYADPKATRDSEALEFYDQLRRINKANQPRQRAIADLPEPMQSYGVREAVAQLSPEQKARWGDAFAHRGQWRAEDMYDMIGIFYKRAGATISDWCDRERKRRGEQKATP
jgi:hypothetical protein